MAGIPQWQKNVQVQANPSFRVRLVAMTYDDEIEAGGTKTVTVLAPSGYVSQIIALNWGYNIFTATSGTKELRLHSTGIIGLTRCVVPFDKLAQFTYGEFASTATTKLPTDATSQMLVLQNAVCDEDTNLTFSFVNDTDAPDGGASKWLSLFMKDYKVG